MKFLRIGGVVLGALLITTLGISAADVLTNGTNGSMLGQLISSTEQGGCPSGMIPIAVGQTFSCVDMYEVSAGEECPNTSPKHNGETQENINMLECLASSEEGGAPWTHVSREQAKVLCMRSGKRLPTASEWYIIAIGTPDIDDSCNTHGRGITPSGASENCRSASGVFDTVGNVWEWTSDDVIEGIYAGRLLPEEGYVTQVASDGVATISAITPSEQFASDYIWSQKTGAYGILRGGFYASGEDSGVFSIQAKTAPTAATAAIGFRCLF